MVDPAEYCRQIETYLCRKNEGHLIRIVGPVFEQVSGWAAQCVPLTIAFRGIDQYCERYYAKGPRRRPVRVEFCEADVLSLFDDWRRAVGVPQQDAGESADKSHSLPKHLDRVIARLNVARGGKRSAAFDRRLDETVRELEVARQTAKHARGGARSALIDRLASLDRELLGAARTEIDEAERASLKQQADSEIAPFAGRMSADAKARAADAAFDRLLRDLLNLPILNPEP